MSGLLCVAGILSRLIVIEKYTSKWGLVNQLLLNTKILALGRILHLKKWKVATAESCTGGLVAQMMTDQAGSSQWFDRAYVTYSNQAKQEMLGVSSLLIEQHGAVSEPVVKAMVKGVFVNSEVDVAVAISGIAGPEGGGLVKPVGTVWLAWGVRDGDVVAGCERFFGNRDAVRVQSAWAAIDGLIDICG